MQICCSTDNVTSLVLRPASSGQVTGKMDQKVRDTGNEACVDQTAAWHMCYPLEVKYSFVFHFRLVFYISIPLLRNRTQQEWVCAQV